MNGRWFAGRQLVAMFYDGFTNYFVGESEEERAARDKEWEKWLQGNDNYVEANDTANTDQNTSNNSKQTKKDNDDDVEMTNSNTAPTKKSTSKIDDEDLIDDW